MKEVVFTEEQLHGLDEIGRSLFGDERDPRSYSYIRKLKRPKVSLAKTLFRFIFLPVVVLAGIVILLIKLNLPKPTVILITSVILLVYIFLTAKRMAINAIKLYQRYAPDSLRNKCRFEPSCSEYMILAIEKYGLVKGVRKGIKRLNRCNISGGGFDYP